MNGKVELITQAEYARRRGVAKSAVKRAVDEGRIRLIDGKIDPEVADIQWAKNTRARADSRGRSAEAASTEDQLTLGASEAPAGAEARAQQAPTTGGAQDPGYYDARARRERADAERAELEVARMAGRLVEKDRVHEAVFEAFRQLRDRVMAVPRRCAPSVVGMREARDVEHAMTAELRQALHAFEEQTLESLKGRLES